MLDFITRQTEWYNNRARTTREVHFNFFREVYPEFSVSTVWKYVIRCWIL